MKKFGLIFVIVAIFSISVFLFLKPAPKPSVSLIFQGYTNDASGKTFALCLLSNGGSLPIEFKQNAGYPVCDITQSNAGTINKVPPANYQINPSRVRVDARTLMPLVIKLPTGTNRILSIQLDYLVLGKKQSIIEKTFGGLLQFRYGVGANFQSFDKVSCDFPP